MAKVDVTITHHEHGTFDIGDMSPEMFQDLLKTYLSDGNSRWSLSDLGADWTTISLQVGNLEPVEL